MKTLKFSTEQVTKIVSDLKTTGTDSCGLMKIFLEAMMSAEREEYKVAHQDMSNGYRPRRAYGQGKVLELKVPRTRFGNFYPVLLSVLKDQQAEMERLSFSLYSAGLTTLQVGEIFEQIYGKHYSSSSISRMADHAREEVSAWLERPLDSYYPILYIDCTFVPVRRAGAVTKEAFYTVLGVRQDRTREVLSIVNLPSESAIGWRQAFEQLQERGVQEIGLLVSDGLKGLGDSLASVFSGTPHQLCVVHLMRHLAGKVKRADRKRLMEELKEVFSNSDSNQSQQSGYQQFNQLCNRWTEHYSSFSALCGNLDYLPYFTYLNYHPKVRPMLYTTNWIERLNRDYKRTLKMRGALPNPEAVILLMARVALTRKAFDRKLPHLNKEENAFKWLD